MPPRAALITKERRSWTLPGVGANQVASVMSEPKVVETCPGNCSLQCPVCTRRFWKWAENYSRRFDRPKGKRARAKAPTGGKLQGLDSNE